MQKGTNEYIRRLSVVLNDSNDAITVQDLVGKILAWNKGAETMYGYSEFEALTMNISELLPKDTTTKYMDYLNRIKRGEVVEAFESQRITKTGKILDISLVLTCLRNDSGEIDSVATTERDITEIKNALRLNEPEVKSLSGLLPICSSCKQIRDDKGYWHQIESYIKNHSDAEFTHGICPKCIKILYPNLNLGNKKIS